MDNEIEQYNKFDFYIDTENMDKEPIQYTIIDATDGSEVMTLKLISELNSWAKESTALCIKYGIVVGSSNTIKAEDNIARAEVAVIVRRLLQKSKLI